MTISQEFRVVVTDSPGFPVSVSAQTEIEGEKHDITFTLENEADSDAISMAFSMIWPAYVKRLSAPDKNTTQ